MQRFSFFVILFIFNYHLCYPQHKNTVLDSRLEEAWVICEDSPDRAIKIADSVKKVAEEKKFYLTELNTINALSYFNLCKRDFKSSERYAFIGLRLSSNYKHPEKKGLFFNSLGLAAYTQAHYNKAAVQYTMAAKIFLNNHEQRFLATAYLNSGMAYRKLSQFKQANTFYFKSAEIYMSLNDSLSLAGVYQSIGNVFDAWGKYTAALKYYKSGLEIAYHQKDKSLLAQGYNNVGYAFLQLGALDSAIKHLNIALAIRNKGAAASRVLLLQNLAAAWRKKGNLLKAQNYLDIALRTARNNIMEDELLRGLLDYSDLLIEKKDYPGALKFSIRANTLAQTLQSNDLRLKSLLLSSKAYQLMNQYKSALLIENQADKLREKIFSQAEAKALKELEVRYETRQGKIRILGLEKEQRLSHQLVSGQRRFIVLLVSASVILLLFLAATVKLYLDKRRAANKIRLLNSELHHRVKNNLQTLSSLFNIQLSHADNEQVKKNIRENELRLQAMNLIHKQLYENDKNTYINLKRLLADLAQNVTISFGQKGASAKMFIKIESIEVDAEKAVAIGLMVNEILTNSLKYASSEQEVELRLNVVLAQDILSIEISDNGKGFSFDGALNKKSFGLKLIRIMSEQLASKMQFENTQGAFYRFLIPHKTRF